MNYTIKKLAEDLVKYGYYVKVGDKEKAVYHNKKGYHKDPAFPELENINKPMDEYLNKPAKFSLRFGTEKEIKELHYNMLPSYVRRVKEGGNINDEWYTIKPEELKKYATPDLITEIKEGKEKYIQIGSVGHMVKYTNDQFKIIQVDRLTNLRKVS